jgi:hypothetical protein
MSKWYMVTPECSYGMQDTKSTEGMYEANRILPVGSIVPFEWKGLQRIRDLYIPANYLVDYEPSEDDWPILYMLWPSLRPHNVQFSFVENPRIGNPDSWAAGWYQVQKPDAKRNMSSVPYGLAALCDVEGICKAGDVVMPGDIVPAPFFAGLSFSQFERLETIGLCSEQWLDTFDARWRGKYLQILARPAIERVAVSIPQRQALYEKFPAMSPQVKVEAIPKVEKKRKG